MVNLEDDLQQHQESKGPDGVMGAVLQKHQLVEGALSGQHQGERADEQRPEAKKYIQRPPSEYFRQLYFDSLTHSTQTLTYLVESIGADRVMMGTDYPFDMGDYTSVKSIASLPHVPERQKQLMWGDTAQELFRIG